MSTTVADRSRASARLGLTLRTVLMSPGRGFEAAFRLADRRERTNFDVPEGTTPYVLAGLGGSATMILWLKVGGLAGLRSFAAADFRWGSLAAVLVLGALFGVLGQLLWARLGTAILAVLDGNARRRDLRIAWGLSALPHAVGVVLLVPLDLLVVGPETFTTERLGDPVSTAWAAFSIALAAGLAGWSLYLFVQGIRRAGDVGPWRGLVASAAALLCFVVAAVVFLGAAVLLAGRMG
jgi:hypothetical protein